MDRILLRDLRLSCTEVATRIASSEWGERERRQRWCRIVLELERGGRRFRRGIGAPDWPSPRRLCQRADELIEAARGQAHEGACPDSGPVAVVLAPAALVRIW